MSPSTYQKGTIAGDNPKAFEERYRFKPHGDTDPGLRLIWAAKTRENGDTLPGKGKELNQMWEQFKTANPDY